MGATPAARTGERGTTCRISTRGLLVGDGYLARQESSGGAVGFQRCAVEDLEMNAQFWTGKRVLITGHTGFKGSWISLWLQKLGAVVAGFALPAPAESLFRLAGVDQEMESAYGDIRS